MKLDELFESIDADLEEIVEGAKPIWRRQGNKVVRGYRCMTGKKQGRIVANPATCGGKVDLKKSKKLKQLMLQKGKKLRKKAKRTMKKNPTSKRLQQLNKKAGQ